MKLENSIYEIMNGNTEICGRSHICDERGELLIFRCDGHRFAAVKGAMAKKFTGRTIAGVKICLPDHENRLAVNELFPWTVPVPLGGRCASLGCGDRLGYANPPQLHALMTAGIKPVLGQQTPEELSWTGRRMRDVVDTAVWAAVEEGYRGGFGCDADELSTMQEITAALNDGCTMITIDFYRIPAANDVERVAFLKNVQDESRSRGGAPMDLEISLEGADAPTDISEHRRIADMLQEAGIAVTSLALKWPEPEAFAHADDKGREVLRPLIRGHASIAENFGYRLSLHYGSRRRDILPVLAEETGGVYHVKMAGNAWIAAVECIYRHDTALYRRMFSKTAGCRVSGDSFETEEQRSLLFYRSCKDVLSSPGMRDDVQEFLRNHRLIYREKVLQIYNNVTEMLKQETD